MKKWIGIIVAALIIFGGVIPFIREAGNHISEGTSKDITRLNDIESSQNIRINEDHPLQGILSEYGVLSNTGKAIKEEGSRGSDIIGDFFTDLLIMAVIAGVLAFFIFRNKDRDSQNRNRNRNRNRYY